MADILDDEPPTSWASVIEMAFRCQRGDFPASPSWEKKEFSQKPISMSNKAYSETNKKYKEILADVEEAVKSASDESERYSSLVKILKVHKGCDFRNVSTDYFFSVLALINLRPRKRLDWRSPFEVFFGVALD